MGERDEIPAWDISPLVEKEEPEYVKGFIDGVLERAKSFEDKYKGRISSLSPEEMLKLWTDHDNLWTEIWEPYSYAYLAYAADSSDSGKSSLFEYARKAHAELEACSKSMKMELSKMLQERPDILNESVIVEYKHALEKLKEEGRYYLSETEERLILRKDRHGIDSWSFLHGALRGSRRYEIEIDGEKQELGYIELSNLIMSSPDRELRRNASESLHVGLSTDRLVWSYALRSVFSDFVDSVRMRKYPDVYTQSLVWNDIDRDTLDALISTMKNHTVLIHRYLKLKARIMELPKLCSYDLDAPVSDSTDKITWSEARRLIGDSFLEFDQESGEFAESLFERRRIDAALRSGKTSYGECFSVPSLNTSWIMINFDESLMTTNYLAHEIGHALHSFLASKEHLWTNIWAGWCLSECASIFGQLLLNEKLLAQADDNAAKISLICSILDNFRLMVFDMLVRFIFETNALTAVEHDENLDADKLDSIWAEARSEVYGDIVDWPPEMDSNNWWIGPPHHYMPNFRFYNYPYSFGQILAFALYGMYKKEGSKFVPKLKRVLSAGGSIAPKELLSEIGFDIATTEFWAIGFKQAIDFLENLERIVL